MLGSGSNPRDLKIKLAKEIVTLCHSLEDANRAEQNFEKSFSKGGIPEDVLEVVIAEGTTLVDVLLSENIVSSKTDWRRLVEEGAVTHMESEKKVGDVSEKIKYGVYKIGKRRFIKIKQ